MSNTQQYLRNKTVLERLLEMNEDATFVNDIATALDIGFDELLHDDVFGTEGQLDPRGDHRNGDFDMYNIEGVDK
jgi:hypothetical protein